MVSEADYFAFRDETREKSSILENEVNALKTQMLTAIEALTQPSGAVAQHRQEVGSTVMELTRRFEELAANVASTAPRADQKWNIKDPKLRGTQKFAGDNKG